MDSPVERETLDQKVVRQLVIKPEVVSDIHRPSKGTAQSVHEAFESRGVQQQEQLEPYLSAPEVQIPQHHHPDMRVAVSYHST